MEGSKEAKGEMRQIEVHALASVDCADARSEADTCSNDLRGTCKVVVQRICGMIQTAPVRTASRPPCARL